ncbi:thioredoxin [Leucobacter albus]|uniref:Thioredoxin n=1 Tax=Leucobacter albus TaxID=272210 RepID=A0ABW3TMA5_9MICO
MSTVEITKDNLEQTIADGGIVVLDFWAAWCGPCRSFAPVFEKASEANDDIVFGKIDTEAEQELAGMFGITSIPTIMAFRDGINVFAQAGALPAPTLDQLIDAVRGLDMEDVRAQLAKEAEGGEAGGAQASDDSASDTSPK